MKLFLSLLLGLALNTYCYSQAQPHVFEEWRGNNGSQNFFYKNLTRTDVSGNVFVSGATMNGAGNYDILVAKYNSQGVQQWIQQYNGLADNHDAATAIAIDASGNVYITGVVLNDTVVPYGDIITIKYNSSGVQQWVATYNGAGGYHDSGSDVIADASGNVYITGSSYNAALNTDYITIKYNSSGVQQWATVYAHSSNMNDAAAKLSLRPAGSVTVVGAVQTGSTSYSLGSIRYSDATGAQTAATISGTSSSGIIEVNDIVTDVVNNIYIAGAITVPGENLDYCVIKLSGSMAILWEQTYNGTDTLNDIAKGIQLETSGGNVYVTGYTTNTGEGRNMTTIKYNSSGVQQWVQSYNDTLNLNDEAYSIALDATGNSYITGYKSTSLSEKDYYTIKYNTSGTEQWAIASDGSKHLNDVALNIAIDNSNAVIVTGQSETAPLTYEYVTIKYVQKNVVTPTDFNAEDPDGSFLYYKNKGQLLNTSDSLIPDVKFYTNNTDPAYYFKDNSYSMVFGRIDSVLASQDTLHRIDVTFNSALSTAKTYEMEETEGYLNYFLGHCPNGITKIHGNQRLVTSGLYQNIDLVYYSNEAGFKYYFIVKPGGSPANIQMEFTGPDTCLLDTISNELSILSSIGGVTFDQPTVYQLDASNVIVPVTGWTADWQRNGANNKYKFNLGTYDSTKVLVIQVDMGSVACSPYPSYKNIRWSSYYGGTYWDWERAIAVDTAGFTYHVGSCTGATFLLSTGALITSNASGNSKGLVSQFDWYGKRKWATYYGGSSGSEEIYGVAISSSQEPTFVGTTFANDFPIVFAGNQYGQPTRSGYQDGFIVRLSTDGLVQKWSTYFGGSGSQDKMTGLAAGVNGIYTVGNGDNNSPHVIKTGAYNSPTSPTGRKGVISHFNTQDSLVWSTFIGEEIDDVDASSGLVGIGGMSKAGLPYKSGGTSLC